VKLEVGTGKVEGSHCVAANIDSKLFGRWASEVPRDMRSSLAILVAGQYRRNLMEKLVDLED
jgi:hypothetical protein